MHINREQIQEMDRVKRLRIINSVSGIKPANLIGTKSAHGNINLAIFSSVIHLGSKPAILGFVMRPAKEFKRDTYNNIMDTGHYTINHIQSEFIEQAHYTSAKFASDISEFEMCGFEEEYIGDFPVPFVKESSMKIGMKFLESIDIKSNGTTLLIGSIEKLIIPDHVIDESGSLDLEKLDNVGISGLNSYYGLKKIAEFPYARVSELPRFEKEGV